MADRLFSHEETNRASAALSGDPLCARCGLHKKCHSPRMKATGRGRKKILVIAEAPGKVEDRRGEQLVGDAGKYLRKELKKLGIDLDQDCRKINTVNCRPPKNREPEPHEIDACRPFVMREIKKFRPEKIFLMGGTALDGFLAHKYHESPGGIMRWRGVRIPDREVEAYVFPMLHPSYVLRSDKYEIIKTTFQRDLKKAVEFEIPERGEWQWDPGKRASILKDPDKINKAILTYMGSGAVTAIDYETTGIKPYAMGHDIYTVGMANWVDESISFPLYPDVRKQFRRFLKSPVPKTAHNMKFEELWSRVILNTSVNGWDWCSMEASHILDNRKGTNELDFLAYVYFGLLSWGVDMKPYLKSGKKDANAFNRIKEAPINSLLSYGGQDAMVQLMLRAAQRKEMGLAT